MSEFKVIETQEEFDRIIQKRLAQKEAEVSKKYEGYLSPDDIQKLKADYDGKLAQAQADLEAMATKVAAHDQEVADLTARAVKAETSLLKGEVANKHGIPLELAGRLIGDTKEDLEKDAESFASYMGPKAAPPLRSNDPANQATGLDGAYAAVLSQLTQN